MPHDRCHLNLIDEITFQDVSIGSRSIADVARPENLICITLYNENLESFRATLSSAIRSLENEVGEPHLVGRSIICVIVDGMDRLSSDVDRFLHQTALVRRLDDNLSVSHHFVSSHRSDQFLAMLGSETESQGYEPTSFDLIVAMKHENSGKLHSHAVFFCDLGARLNPEFCFQIDTGTVLERNAIAAMVDDFKSRPWIGALASSSAPPAPACDEGLLHSWQFLHFVHELSIARCAEVMSGHLGVLPGQFCGFRWSALIDAWHRDEIGDRDNREHVPVFRYLRGLTAENSFRKMMYLAEDRIIGTEIATARDSVWKLDFCYRSNSISDACPSFVELARQRRRWNNASTACRIAHASEWIDLLQRRDRSVLYKLRMTFATLWQIHIMMLHLLSPAIGVAFFGVLVTSLWRLAEYGKGALSVAIVAAYAVWITAVLLRSMLGNAQSRKRAGLVADILAVTLFTAHGLVICATFSPWFVLAGYGPALAVIFPLISFYRDRKDVLIRWLEYVLFNPFFGFGLLAYSFWHIDDTSWGTKGLTGRKAGRYGKAPRRLRVVVLGAWLALNIGLVALSWGRPGIQVANMNPVLEYSFVSLVVTALLAMLFYAQLPFRQSQLARTQPYAQIVGA